MCRKTHITHSLQSISGRLPKRGRKRRERIEESKNVQTTRGWSGGAKVLGKLPVPGRPTFWITVGQGPIALAVGAGGGCLDVFTLVYHFSFLSPSLWETTRYRLKYCLKGSLSPKQPTKIQTTPTRTCCKRNRPLPYYHLNCRTPRHWKFTQHHRTSRPPPKLFE